MMHISKLGLFALTVFLLLVVLSWPYVTKHTHYNIREMQEESATIASDELTTHQHEGVAEKASASSDTRVAAAVDDGAMVFRGHTQVIISPEPKT